MSAIDPDIERLFRLDCCAVSDALDKLKLPGAVTGLAQLSAPRRIAGRAVTVKLGVGSPPPGRMRHLGTAAVEASGPGDILIAAKEAAMAQALRSGRPIGEVMGASYELLLK